MDTRTMAALDVRAETAARPVARTVMGAAAGAVVVCALLGGLTACSDGGDAAPATAAAAAAAAKGNANGTPRPSPASPPASAPTTPTAPTPTAPTSTTQTNPAAVPPERPSAMDTADTPGAEAAARYFVELLPYAEATGDATQFGAMSLPECDFCAREITRVAENAAAGLHRVGGVPEVTWVRAFEVEPGASWTVDVDLEQGPSTLVDATGTVTAEQTGSNTYHLDVEVTRDGEGWNVSAVESQVVAFSE